MVPVYNIKTVNNRKKLACIGGICNQCGEDYSTIYHYNKCIMPYKGGNVVSKQSSDKATVRIVKNGEIHHVRPEDLHNPTPLRTKSKGAVCSECGAKESMCECWTDIEDDSDDDAPGAADETPSAAASHAEPPGSFLPFF